MVKFDFKQALFSPAVLKAGNAKKLALIGIFTALNVVFNTAFEIRFADVQFSLTIFISCVTGALLGSVFGFFACFLGDFIGFVINSWGYVYMAWVGLSTALTAFIAGIIINGIKFDFKGADYVKTVLISALAFLICTVGVNSTGFYFYNYGMGFSQAVIDYVSERFGGEVGYLGYLIYRLFFKGQIFNCVLNYALTVAFLPALLRIKIFKAQE